MNKIVIISAAVMTLIACTAKKETLSTTPPKTEQSLESKLSAVQLKYPGTTLAVLEKGKTISKTACVNCHKEKDLTKGTDEKIFKEIDIMSKKAKISEEDRQALIRYATALRAVVQ